MPGTALNEAEFPHPKTRKKVVGLPIARAVAILSLATAAVIDAAIGPYQGKETVRPAWMDQATSDRIPATRELRERRYTVVEKDRRTKQITVVTTLTDPGKYSHELWTTLLAYHLIRTTVANAAALHEKKPRHISFTSTCQYVLASWPLLSGNLLTPAQIRRHCLTLLAQVANCEVANRSGRLKPRVIRRRRHGDPIKQESRTILRAKSRKHCT